MNIARIILGIVLVAALPAHAASVSYFLDQSNALPDGTGYLQVTLTATEDGVDFRVQTLAPLNDVAGGNFGIQKFGFNFTDDASFEITGLPSHWRAREDKQMSEFGSFDIRLQGSGSTRTSDLSFSVGGAVLSDFGTFFAAHVAGFEWCFDGDNSDDVELGPWSEQKSNKSKRDDYWARKGDRIDGDRDEWIDSDSDGHPGQDGGKPCRDGKDCITSAYFGGGNDAIPLPASAWLLISGMVGFGAVIRRRRNSINAD